MRDWKTLSHVKWECKYHRRFYCPPELGRCVRFEKSGIEQFEYGSELLLGGQIGVNINLAEQPLHLDAVAG